VKLLPDGEETRVLAQSADRIAKERSMRRRRVRAYVDRLRELQARKRPVRRDEMHQALGAAKQAAGRDARFLKVTVHVSGQADDQRATIGWTLDRAALRTAWRREGRYLLRTNLAGTDPAKLWEFYLQLTEVEQAFKELKGDLSLRPFHHQLEARIEAHTFICFLAYSLQVTLKARLRQTANGLTPRAVLEKFAAVQMIDVHLPTSDGREIVMSRYTQPEKDLQLLLDRLHLTLPKQSPPKIHALKKG
jgi:transposase